MAGHCSVSVAVRARMRQDLGGWKGAESRIRQVGRGELLLKEGGVLTMIFVQLMKAFVLIEGYADNLSIITEAGMHLANL